MLDAQMDEETPLAAVKSLVAVRDRGDVESAMGCYEENATIVVQPGEIAAGELTLRSFIEACIALRLSFRDRRIIGDAEIALHFSRWSGNRA